MSGQNAVYYGQAQRYVASNTKVSNVIDKFELDQVHAHVVEVYLRSKVPS